MYAGCVSMQCTTWRLPAMAPDPPLLVADFVVADQTYQDYNAEHYRNAE